jgi:anti-anti-sigma factor
VTELAKFDIKSFVGYLVIVATGEIDIGNAGDFRIALQNAAPAGSQALIVSLAGIRYLDSNALAVLIELSRRFAVSRRQLAVVCPTDSSCGKLVRIAGLHNVLSMYESTEEAVAGIADM